ncbi:MAG: glycolate oxidase subunit GlcE [Rhodocyclaceae bacterium]|nr:glycolate oxidase subunit GlcE [Rhodocyclaceae bacterium]MBL0074798.1 glycolate oxidase subunit GlcE [Rhodocyclaceae bacterium]MBP6110052.1 glycolate oxidase subunit GlcE [Rhodocyclaceae bacterium]MBP6278784.1 glycolate oxidase subunit GlcE [Rhodocyclaceae bacterium]
MSSTTIDEFRQQILQRQPLRIRGGGSKDFYGSVPSSMQESNLLDTRMHSGIVSYDPSELVVTVKAGTTLQALELVLATRRQFLPFEPPRFGDDLSAATIGGAVAAGLSGPRRATVGALRDFVLGLRLMDGVGRELKFGGEVMKNVAGYDVSRLMAGSMGCLGLILDVSLKVLPMPMHEATIGLALDQQPALELMNQWGGEPLPISATCWADGLLMIRLSGAEPAVRTAQQRLGGDLVEADQAAQFWASLRDGQHAFFAQTSPHATLWRLSVPSVTPPLEVGGSSLIEWGGAQRWFHSEASAEEVQTLAHRCGATATAFRYAPDRTQVFSPFAPGVLKLHQSLKHAFDPHGIFGRGRLYPEI